MQVVVYIKKDKVGFATYFFLLTGDDTHRSMFG